MTKFNSLADAEKFKADNQSVLMDLQNEVLSVGGVSYCEVWLNGSAPSFVAGMDTEDNHIVSFKI